MSEGGNKKATTVLDICIAVPGLPFCGEDFDKKSIGGSESSGHYLAKALDARGHRVTVFTTTEKPSRSGEIYYLPLDMYRQYVEFTPHDVLIVQRAPEMFGGQNLARFSALWCHDLALGRATDTVRGTAWNYDKLFVLSEFMRRQYKETYGLPDELLFTTRNGIDLATVQAARAELLDEAARAGSASMEIVRDPFQLVYSARPERGADVLFSEVMPRILAIEPRAHLACCSYYNPVDHLREYYAQCSQLAKQLGDRARFVGNLTKKDLYKLYLQSGQYVYPVPSVYAPDFAEVYCISALESMACGLPMVTSKHGALPEVLHPEAGVLIEEPTHSEAYYDAFARAVVTLMHDEEAWGDASRVGQLAASTKDWAGVAEEWEALFIEEIRKRSAHPLTLANHFWRHSDIYAAREVISRAVSENELPVPQLKALGALEARINKEWGFIDEEDGFRKHYEVIGITHDPAVVDWVGLEPRYMVLREWLRKHEQDVQTVLDYGCAHGAYAANLARELPHLRILGVDIDENGVALGRQFAEKFNASDRCMFETATHEKLPYADVLGEPQEGEIVFAVDHEKQLAGPMTAGAPLFDCVIAQEVLEHVPEPWEVLKALEARVRDGGYVYITVPFGPWEYTDYRRYPHRAHVWEFDLHDLYDMLLAKPVGAEVTVNAMPAPEGVRHNPVTGEPQGWWLVMYKVTPETRGILGKIDMERKLWCQRPRQTVSACIIAGSGSRETLLWCLDSLEHVADQVVIVDCGMSDADHAVLALSAVADRVLMVPGVDPKSEGFDTARNKGLKYCVMDWVLWIDTDEKLIQPEMIAKYLRPNTFQGYSIHQHHFAVDTHFEPDMPVRLFRNNGKLHWVGKIHEHPESDVNEGPGLTVVLRDVHIPHVGYLVESGRKLRFARNLPLLVKDCEAYPKRLLQKHFIMRDNMMLSSYELQRNGGQVTPEIQARAQQTVNLWKEYFRGRETFSNIDPITYYSQANAMLGQGFDFYLSVSADKIDAKPNGHLKVRFADEEDMLAEVQRRAKSAAHVFANPRY